MKTKKTVNPAAKPAAKKSALARRPARVGKTAEEKPVKTADEKLTKAVGGARRAAATAEAAPAGGAGKHASVKERDRFKEMLLAIRERLVGQISALKSESLTREDDVNSEEDGTDAFDRQFALNLVSSEHDALFEIDEALRRLAEGTYGACEQCSKRIEPPRLKALPFVRTCIQCQSKLEGGKSRLRSARERL